MSLSRAALPLFLALLLMPFLALAQMEEDVLRETIRADIMSDPRSSEMSPAEIDTLVSALATQAETQGDAQDYLEAQSSFSYAVEPPIYEPETGINPMAVALLVLCIVLIVVVFYIVRSRRIRSERLSGPAT